MDYAVVPSIFSSASSWVSEVSPAARNTLDFARIPRAPKLLICGLFQKGRVLAQDTVNAKCDASGRIRNDWATSIRPPRTAVSPTAQALSLR